MTKKPNKSFNPEEHRSKQNQNIKTSIKLPPRLPEKSIVLMFHASAPILLEKI
jgi:hypothetical protein